MVRTGSWLLGVVLVGHAGVALAGDTLTVKETKVDRPTLIHLGVQVTIADDDDRDATIGLRYRELGAPGWEDGPALVRVRAELVTGMTVAPQFAGTVFGLRPDTDYELELHAQDPDGLDDTWSVQAHTRPVPGDPQAPQDLRARALAIAAAVLELSGAAPEARGATMAEEALTSGRAWTKFQRICAAQGGMREPPVAPLTRSLAAPHSGIITHINNRKISRLAKLAGAPDDKAAGVEILARLGEQVTAGAPLVIVHERGGAVTPRDIVVVNKIDRPGARPHAFGCLHDPACSSRFVAAHRMGTPFGPENSLSVLRASILLGADVVGQFGREVLELGGVVLVGGAGTEAHRKGKGCEADDSQGGGEEAHVSVDGGRPELITNMFEDERAHRRARQGSGSQSRTLRSSGVPSPVSCQPEVRSVIARSRPSVPSASPSNARSSATEVRLMKPLSSLRSSSTRISCG